MPLGSISSADLAAADADKPFWLARNQFANPRFARWIYGVVWDDPLGNITTTVHPISRAFNGRPWDYTTGAIVVPIVSSSYSLILRYQAPPSATFDTLVIHHAEGPETSGTSTFTLDVASDASGSPGAWQTLMSEEWETDQRRQVVTNIAATSNPERWIGTQWVRLAWSSLLRPPKVLGVYAGERIQFPCAPQRPHDLVPSASRFSPSRSGYSRLTDYRDARHHRLEFLMKDYDEARFGGINGRDRARKVWTESEYGSQTVLYFPSPSSSPDAVYMYSLESSPDFSLVGPRHSVCVFDVLELPSFAGNE